MAGIYCADIYCDDCIKKIKDDIAFELWDGVIATMPDGSTPTGYTTYDELWDYLDSMDEHTYDSDSYPKYCLDNEVSDTPQHCGSGADCLNYSDTVYGDRCGHFFGNNLTSEGEDYVKDEVNCDLLSGCTDSVAVQLWMPCYSYLDYVEQCANCGEYVDYGGLDMNDECDECDECANNAWYTGKAGDDLSVQHDSYESAVKWIDNKSLKDPAGVAAGEYYIDGPDNQ